MKKTLTPTILGIAIVATIVLIVLLTSFNCVSYAR